jgi:hypothetical protein
MGRANSYNEHDAFWNKVMPEPNTGCWLWTGFCDEDGYGQFHTRGKNWKPHRWSYTHFVGPIPEGLEIDHRCRVHCCVNPEHLDAATVLVNRSRIRHGNGRGLQETCKRGHPMVPENTYYKRGRNARQCRTCVIARAKADYRKKRSAQ